MEKTSTARLTAPTHQETQATLDRLSLDQALADFEVANARVVDLTQRVITATDTILHLEEELGRVRRELAGLRELHEQMKASQAFRLAEKIWHIRNALGI